MRTLMQDNVQVTALLEYIDISHVCFIIVTWTKLSLS